MRHPLSRQLSLGLGLCLLLSLPGVGRSQVQDAATGTARFAVLRVADCAPILDGLPAVLPPGCELGETVELPPPPPAGEATPVPLPGPELAEAALVVESHHANGFSWVNTRIVDLRTRTLLLH